MTGSPNVVLVVLDTARAAEAPPIDRTVMPTLSELAAEATVCRNAFASAPWTLPSHASLFTGLYPSEHGAHGAHTYLDESVTTLPEAFAAAGYETLAVSNNTWITPTFGFGRGFDRFWKGWQYLQSDSDVGGVVRADYRLETLRAAARELFEGNPLVNAVNMLYSEFGQPTGDDGATRTTARVESWLADRADPFFLFVNYIEPHVEYHPPRECARPFLPADATVEEALAVRQDPQAYNAGVYDVTDRERALLLGLYRGELRYVDRQLDRLRQSLQAAGHWEETIFLVVGDHGEHVAEHGLLGHQYSLRDALLHVPLVVRGGVFSREPRTVEDLVQLTDVVPTLLAETGIDAPDLESRGRSFHPDAPGRREAVFAEHVAPKPSVAQLRDRFGEVPGHLAAFDPPLRAIRTPERKLVRDGSGNERQSVPGDRRAVPAGDPRLGARLTEWVDSLDRGEAAGEAEIAAATEARLAELGYL